VTDDVGRGVRQYLAKNPDTNATDVISDFIIALGHRDLVGAVLRGGGDADTVDSRNTACNDDTGGKPGDAAAEPDVSSPSVPGTPTDGRRWTAPFHSRGGDPPGVTATSAGSWNTPTATSRGRPSVLNSWREPMGATCGAEIST
jgi:hypothetical protein